MKLTQVVVAQFGFNVEDEKTHEVNHVERLEFVAQGPEAEVDELRTMIQNLVDVWKGEKGLTGELAKLMAAPPASGRVH